MPHKIHFLANFTSEYEEVVSEMRNSGNYASAKAVRSLLDYKTFPIPISVRFDDIDYGNLPKNIISSYRRHKYQARTFTLPSNIHNALDCLQALAEVIKGFENFKLRNRPNPFLLFNGMNLIPLFEQALLPCVEKNNAASNFEKGKLLEKLGWLSTQELAENDEMMGVVSSLLDQARTALPISCSEKTFIASGRMINSENALATLLTSFQQLAQKPACYRHLSEAIAQLLPSITKEPSCTTQILTPLSRYQLLFNFNGPALLSPQYGISEKYRILRQIHRSCVESHEPSLYVFYITRLQAIAKTRWLEKSYGKRAQDGEKYNKAYTEIALLNEATISLREDGKIGIQVSGTKTYADSYAKEKDLHEKLEPELDHLFGVLGIAREPSNCHEEIVLTPKSSVEVMLLVYTSMQS